MVLIEQKIGGTEGKREKERGEKINCKTFIILYHLFHFDVHRFAFKLKIYRLRKQKRRRKSHITEHYRDFFFVQ